MGQIFWGVIQVYWWVGYVYSWQGNFSGVQVCRAFGQGSSFIIFLQNGHQFKPLLEITVMKIALSELVYVVQRGKF